MNVLAEKNQMGIKFSQVYHRTGRVPRTVMGNQLVITDLKGLLRLTDVIQADLVAGHRKE